MTENINRNRNEYAPVNVSNAVSFEDIQSQRIAREITLEVADAARIFNKVLGKISHENAYEIFEEIDFKHYAAYEIVLNAVNNSFVNQPESFYRTDGIVARLQVVLAERGMKDIVW